MQYTRSYEVVLELDCGTSTRDLVTTNEMDEEEEVPTCPLCLEELDATDRAVKACQCGYQVRHLFAHAWEGKKFAFGGLEGYYRYLIA